MEEPKLESNTKTLTKLDPSSHCLLCGARLHFNTVTDWANNMTRERATCPECGTECSHSLHRLQ